MEQNYANVTVCIVIQILHVSAGIRCRIIQVRGPYSKLRQHGMRAVAKDAVVT